MLSSVGYHQVTGRSYRLRRELILGIRSGSWHLNVVVSVLVNGMGVLQLQALAFPDYRLASLIAILPRVGISVGPDIRLSPSPTAAADVSNSWPLLCDRLLVLVEVGQSWNIGCESVLTEHRPVTS